MAKITSKTVTKTVAAKVSAPVVTEESSTKKEKLTPEQHMQAMAPLQYKQVQIVKGRKYPIGATYDCIKIAVQPKYGTPYILLDVDGRTDSCNPENVKPLNKSLTPAQIAHFVARLESETDATLIVGATVVSESDDAVYLRHHGWYGDRWIPKSLCERVGMHSDGLQSLWSIPRWKLLGKKGNPANLAPLEALQEGYRAMLAPKPVKTPAKRK